MRRNRPAIFKGRHFEAEIIVVCIRWYLRFGLSFRDLEELMVERNVTVDHVTIWRWVQRYAPELHRRWRSELRTTNRSWRVDETYLRVAGKWTYLYRAVDSTGGLPQVQDNSPGRSELLVTDFSHELGWPLWTRALKTGASRRVGQVLATAAAWSMEGRLPTSRTGIYFGRTAMARAQKDRELTRGSLLAALVAGRRSLRFTVGNVIDRFGDLAIWEAATDGTGLRPLLPGWNVVPEEVLRQLDPDGRYFVFQAARHGKIEIWATRERRGLMEPFEKSVRNQSSSPVAS